MIYQYLTDFSDYYNLIRHVQLQTLVTKAVYKGESGWTLETQKSGVEVRVFQVSKLVVVTGLGSDLALPRLAGSSEFDKRLFHTKHLAKQSDALRDVKSIAVLGAGKSAMDVAHYYASRGVSVQ